MQIFNMRMVYYIAGCLSSASPLNRQDEAGHKKVQCATMAECMDGLGIKPMTESIIDSVTKLEEYTRRGKYDFYDLLEKDLPYRLDIQTASQYIRNPFSHTLYSAIIPPTRLKEICLLGVLTRY